MAATINKQQFTKQKYNSGLTEQNNLATALMTRPEVVSKALAYVFGERYTMQFLTMGAGRVSSTPQIIGNDQFRWPLQGNLLKAIPIVAAPVPATDIGKNFTEFQLTLSERYFAVGDVLATHSRASQIRVQREPENTADGVIYTFTIVGNNEAESVPVDDLTIGRELSIEYTAFEEFSRGGSSKEAFPMWFQNQMTTSRTSFSMSGSAQTDVMILEVGGKRGKNATSKKTKLWMYEKEYQTMLQMMEQSERLKWYGKYNRTPQGEVRLPGENGRPVKIGAGVLEQIATSNKRNYTEATAKLFREFILDLMDNSQDASNKKFIAFTGKGGLDEFSRAMKEELNKATIVDSKFVTGSGVELTLGAEFTTYKGLLGTELTVVHLPLLDNPVSNRQTHPKTGYPIESYRFIILDFSMYGGESNISLIAKGADGIDRSLKSWYTSGSQSPPGVKEASAKMLASNSLDGWEVHFLSETALKVINPLSCGELVNVIS